ncbi:hypothetical protein [Antrihabitans cavernicola]|uniref:Uncharacterized protein n=1 Tax=Antrihabitans cavernicola TaxID=2495913 RepID=A0A5A7S7Y9_9NOCA|nr:hypothetical protein [Spelaeibacter cavernicola]KAA0021319.1 hypothetical protein FOY51_18900 [Spelaeibacter cavernicola]
MSRRSRLMRRLAAILASGAAGLVFAGTAAAAPAPAVPAIPADLLAAANTPEASAAIANLLGAAGIAPAALELGITTPQPFLYPAPTLGCGIGGTPVTVTVASAQAGPNFPIPPWIERGNLRFQAIPGFVDVPKTSDLSVAWINLGTFQGGVTKLDDSLAGIPTLSKTINTGQGTVLAALFGGVGYTSGKNCFALPTVGSFDA